MPQGSLGVAAPVCLADLRGAAAEAERVRATTEDHVFCAETDKIRRTVSIGLAALDPEQSTVEDLLFRADHALHQAKLQGRNRVSAEPSR